MAIGPRRNTIYVIVYTDGRLWGFVSYAGWTNTLVTPSPNVTYSCEIHAVESFTKDGKVYRFKNWNVSGIVAPGIIDGSTSLNQQSTPYEPGTEAMWAYAMYESSDPPTTLFTISTGTNPRNKGSTSGGGQYQYGANCIIDVSPNRGYYFVGWTSDMGRSSSEKRHSFSVMYDETWTANLEASDGSILCDSSSGIILCDSITGEILCQ